MPESSSALPGVWTSATVRGTVLGLVAPRISKQTQTIVDTLVSGAQVGTVTRKAVRSALCDNEAFDIDGAIYQLSMAGVLATARSRMSTEDACARVRAYILDRRFDTTRYLLLELTAKRFAFDRAVFYVVDDGVLEHALSSVTPSDFIAEFEERYQRRHGASS